jgi:hypothetical protein
MTMLLFLEKYTWWQFPAQPSTGRIFLFLTMPKQPAAIAACLYKHHAAKGDLETVARFSTTD